MILASQGVVQGVDMKILGRLSIIAVIIWLFIGTVATEVAIQYSNYITFIDGLYAELKSKLIFRNLAVNEIYVLLNCK